MRIMQKAIELQVELPIRELLKDVLQEYSFMMSRNGITYPTSLFSNIFYKKILDVYYNDNKKLIELFPETASFFGNNMRESDLGIHDQEISYINKTEDLILSLFALLDNQTTGN